MVKESGKFSGFGLVVGLCMTAGFLILKGISKLVVWFQKGKYKEALIAYKDEMEVNLKEFGQNRESDFQAYKEDLLGRINLSLDLLKANIEQIDEELWKNMKEEYKETKDEFVKNIKLWLGN